MRIQDKVEEIWANEDKSYEWFVYNIEGDIAEAMLVTPLGIISGKVKYEVIKKNARRIYTRHLVAA